MLDPHSGIRSGQRDFETRYGFRSSMLVTCGVAYGAVSCSTLWRVCRSIRLPVVITCTSSRRSGLTASAGDPQAERLCPPTSTVTTRSRLITGAVSVGGVPSLADLEQVDVLASEIVDTGVAERRRTRYRSSATPRRPPVMPRSGRFRPGPSALYRSQNR